MRPLTSMLGWMGQAVAAGAVLGILARAAMRVVAWQSGAVPEFSPGGTLDVILVGVVVGAPLALVVWACCHRYRLRFGIGVGAAVALFGVLSIWQTPATRRALEATADDPPATGAVFLAAFMVYGLVVDTLWELRRSSTPRPVAAFALLVMAQGAHAVEEYLGRLWESFPPAAFLTGLVWRDRELAFLAINAALVAFGAWCFWWPIRKGWRSRRAIGWTWAAIELVNGAAHLAWSVWQGDYTPGALTAPVLLGLAGYLAIQLKPSRGG